MTEKKVNLQKKDPASVYNIRHPLNGSSTPIMNWTLSEGQLRMESQSHSGDILCSE